jgi:TRAP-type C4-dicarboxylate transport system substrate-binding protein
MQWHHRHGLISIVIGIALVMSAVVTTAAAADAKYKLKFVGISRAVDTWPYWEKWAQSVKEKTGGQVEIELVSLPELGFGGVELIKLIKTGVVDVAEIYGGYVAGEMPLMEILELPGIFPDPETAKKAILAWKDTEAKLLRQRAGAELLAMAAYPDQAIFSKKPLKTLDDFRGLKTRVHSVALSSLVAGLGGEPLSIAFAEVYTALERGTVDAAFTGTKPGYDQRWYEVSKYLVGPISMRPHVALSVNRNSWKRLPKDI